MNSLKPLHSIRRFVTYLQCWHCGFQFMSAYTKVAEVEGGLICAKCHEKGVGR